LVVNRVEEEKVDGEQRYFFGIKIRRVTLCVSGIRVPFGVEIKVRMVRPSSSRALLVSPCISSWDMLGDAG
jgi:hypothetical protein